MTDHPCAKGLTAACFAAYPAWARQAFAYKLLHIMLPKQLTKKLPAGLSLALVPPGVVLPPGAIVPPETVFPPGWTPGDPPPPGVQLPPTISPVPPGSGAVPPLYVQPWEPGPAKLSDYLISGETPLIVQGPGDAGRGFGNDDLTYKLYGLIPDSLSVIITKVSIAIGTTGSPVDQVNLEIRESTGPTEPGNIITNGESTPIGAVDLPLFDITNPNLTPISTFYIPNAPQLNSGTTYFLGMTRSAPSNISDYYQVLKFDLPSGKLQYKTYIDEMGASFLEALDFKIYGRLI